MKKGLPILIGGVLLLGLSISFLSRPAASTPYSMASPTTIDSSYDWNEDNTGLGVEYQFEQKSAWRTTAMANGFRDSTDNMSYMAGAGLHRRLFETDKLSGFYVYAGLNAFLMTRNDVNDRKPFPGVLPSLSIGNDKVGFNLTYMPKSGSRERDELDRDGPDSERHPVPAVQGQHGSATTVDQDKWGQ